MTTTNGNDKLPQYNQQRTHYNKQIMITTTTINKQSANNDDKYNNWQSWQLQQSTNNQQTIDKQSTNNNDNYNTQ